MKIKLTTLFILLSVCLCCIVYNGGSHDGYDNNGSISTTQRLDVVTCTSLADVTLDLAGRIGTPTNFSITQSGVKDTLARRLVFKAITKIKQVIAEIHTAYNYDHNCSFYLNQQPRRELFFILRNIRI